MNGYMGQLKGPFKANEDLYKKIQEQSTEKILGIEHLGVQAERNSIICINGKNIIIGLTGIYEVRNTEITSLSFLQDMDEYTILDFTIKNTLKNGYNI